MLLLSQVNTLLFILHLLPAVYSHVLEGDHGEDASNRLCSPTDYRKVYNGNWLSTAETRHHDLEKNLFFI